MPARRAWRHSLQASPGARQRQAAGRRRSQSHKAVTVQGGAGLRHLACRKVSTRSCRRGSPPTRTFSNMKFRSTQLPLPLSGPNMGCVHKTSICRHRHRRGTCCPSSRRGTRDSDVPYQQACRLCICLTLQLTDYVPPLAGTASFICPVTKQQQPSRPAVLIGRMHLSASDQRMPQHGCPAAGADKTVAHSTALAHPLPPQSAPETKTSAKPPGCTHQWDCQAIGMTRQARMPAHTSTGFLTLMYQVTA